MKNRTIVKNNNNSYLTSFFPSLGLSLTLLGVPLGMFINLTFHFECVNLIMFLSLIFIFLGKRQRFNINRGLFIVLLFQLLMISYFLLSNVKTSEYIFYHYYIIILILLLCFTENTLSDTFLLIVIIVSALLSLASVYWGVVGNVLTGGGTIDNLNMANEGTSFFLERITASHPPLVNVISVMSYKREYKGKKWINATLIIIDFIALLILQKRTFIFMAIFSVLLLLRLKKVSLKFHKIIFWSILVFTIGLILSFFLPTVFDLFANFVDNFVIGLRTIFGMERVHVDEAGMGRVLGRANAMKVINNFSYYNYFIGSGYLSTFTDAPLIQSYIDMGILGVVLYFFSVIFYPLQTILGKLQNECIVFSVYMSMLYVLTCVINWNPYMYHIYIPAIILYYFQSQLNGRKRKNRIY